MNRHTVELIALGAIWGFSFIFLRIAVPALGAAPVTFVRLGLAVLLLLTVVMVLRVKVPIATHWRAFSWFGLINTAIPFLLFGIAAKHLPAGYLAVLNGTAALFSAVLAMVMFHQRISKQKIIGIALGLLGVIVLVGLASVPLNANTLTAVAAGLAGAVCYAYAGHLAPRLFKDVSPYAQAYASLLPASVIMFPLAVFNAPTAADVTPKVLTALLFLGFITTGIAYLMYFRVLRALGAVRTSTVAFLIPLFALLWGWVFLDEPITLANVLGGALVLLGVAFVQGFFDKHAR